MIPRGTWRGKSREKQNKAKVLIWVDALDFRSRYVPFARIELVFGRRHQSPITILGDGFGCNVFHYLTLGTDTASRSRATIFTDPIRWPHHHSLSFLPFVDFWWPNSVFSVAREWPGNGQCGGEVPWKLFWFSISYLPSLSLPEYKQLAVLEWRGRKTCFAVLFCRRIFPCDIVFYSIWLRKTKKKRKLNNSTKNKKKKGFDMLTRM